MPFSVDREANSVIVTGVVDSNGEQVIRLTFTNNTEAFKRSIGSDAIGFEFSVDAIEKLRTDLTKMLIWCSSLNPGKESKEEKEAKEGK